MPRYYETYSRKRVVRNNVVQLEGWVRRKVPKQPKRPRNVLAGTLSRQQAVRVAADYRRKGYRARVVRRMGEFHNYLIVGSSRKRKMSAVRKGSVFEGFGSGTFGKTYEARAKKRGIETLRYSRGKLVHAEIHAMNEGMAKKRSHKKDPFGLFGR